MVVSKPLLTEFGIHHRLESCVFLSKNLLLKQFRKTTLLPSILVMNLEELRLLCAQGIDLYFKPCISYDNFRLVPKAHELSVNCGQLLNNRNMGVGPFPIVLIMEHLK